MKNTEKNRARINHDSIDNSILDSVRHTVYFYNRTIDFQNHKKQKKDK